MRITEVIWLRQFVDKLEFKHGVLPFEVEEILDGRKKVRKIGSGDVEGEDLYLALGQTSEGRYLSVFFVLKQGNRAMPISARDMNSKERKLYGRK